MTFGPSPVNRVRKRRKAVGLTQEELAERASISRSAVTAIESERLVPSVAAALAIAQALGGTVESLFGRSDETASAEVWAYEPPQGVTGCWRASIGSRTVLFPSMSTPMWTPAPDTPETAATSLPEETLVIACCDPAAGMLAVRFAAATGLRLLIVPRSSRQSLEMLRDGLVHLAGLHLATKHDPDANLRTVRETLGTEHQLIRVAHWQEGIVSAPSARLRSVEAARTSRLTWIGREAGSGARKCLDEVLQNHRQPRRTARNHRAVTEAVASGWADAGVCVQLASAEAGLDFLPIQQEAYDVCFPATLAEDRRIKAFLGVIRSSAYRKALSELPGYDTSETGLLTSVSEGGGSGAGG